VFTAFTAFAEAALMLLLLGVLISAANATNAPAGLLVNYQASPALGVGLTPQFSWIVAPSSNTVDTMQAAYQIQVTDSGSKTVWDSSKVSSGQSTRVGYTGPQLARGERYTWSVTTWASDSEQSSPSDPAEFVTSSDFNNASFITTASQSTYGYFRKVVDKPFEIASAIAYVTAISNDETLCAYKLYINGKLTSVGPGRPEAPIFGGNSTYMRNPYTTLDVTEAVLDQEVTKTSGKILLAISGVYKPEPGATNESFPTIAGATVMMQMVLRSSTGSTLTLGTDSSWSAFAADVYYNPTGQCSAFAHSP
jgi:alpha-L-rhamnosidase